ncbi:serine/threonine-protein kinase STY17-like protein [Tanacetum coccineum]|uniref:Serine/threonine-protein kinase STY17-like protein n=1 Tax=Tanacetum coccineum TaxID=301880 RepID=A0ABQ5FA95_9ASTR
MNSYTFMGLHHMKVEEEISSRKKSFIKGVIAYIKIRRQASRVTRNSITRDRAGAHERLVAAFFSDNPMYDATRFRKTFRVARPLFNRIVTACTSAIRQLAYGVNASFLDEYMQISERSSRMALDHFCEAVMEIYGPEFMRKPTVTDIEKLYRHHEEKHGFPGMLGSLDCRAPEIPFVANSVSYLSGYYLVDEIYPELAPLVKTIPEPADDDHKRILYKQKQESVRKDVERAFGVLKKKWAVLANLTRVIKKIVNMMYTCIILHNMIRKYKKVAISPKWFPEEAHQPEDLLRNEEQIERVMRWIGSS